MPLKSREGIQIAKFSRFEGKFPSIKHLRERRIPGRCSGMTSAGAPRGTAAPGPLLLQRAPVGVLRAGALVPRSRPSAHAQLGRSVPGGRRRRRRRQPRWNFPLCLHPGSSFAVGDSFLRTLRGFRCHRTSVRQDHGVAQGSGGPESPGGKDPFVPDTSGFLKESRSRGRGAEGPGRRLRSPARFLRCVHCAEHRPCSLGPRGFP